jgi:DNA mismatch endonuclease (patch repair protein)
MPKTNSEWWARTLGRNVKRDRETFRMLRRAGWQVVVAWEHECPSTAARRIMAAVGVPRGRGVKPVRK